MVPNNLSIRRTIYYATLVLAKHLPSHKWLHSLSARLVMRIHFFIRFFFYCLPGSRRHLSPLKS